MTSAEFSSGRPRTIVLDTGLTRPVPACHDGETRIGGSNRQAEVIVIKPIAIMSCALVLSVAPAITAESVAISSSEADIASADQSLDAQV